MTRSAIAAAAFVFALYAAPAEARPARCEVRSAGEKAWAGPCDFRADRGGSFSIAPLGKSRFPGGTLSISVFVLDGRAEVSGLTRDGISSRWGEAHRSHKDPACWEGSDFRVCAR